MTMLSLSVKDARDAMVDWRSDGFLASLFILGLVSGSIIILAFLDAWRKR